ncbi:hypothetical protein TNCT6_17180 [Streptomyces sp. 6-11-2]|nr:hypothetical protein TNCT6_17180 [Streptomyces sp. 6-11-2]
MTIRRPPPRNRDRAAHDHHSSAAADHRRPAVPLRRPRPHGRDRPHGRGPGTDRGSGRRPRLPRSDDPVKAAADRDVARQHIVGAWPVDRTTKTEIPNGCESNPHCRPWH